MPNPGKPNPNYAHPPTDAQRFELRPDPRKQRTIDRSTQSPVVIGNPDYRDIEPVDPAPRFTSITIAKLKSRRAAERKDRNG